MIAKGAKFAWFFTYIPVGNDAAPVLLARADQLKYMYHQIRKFRSTKPIFTMDFWNDGEYVNGCIAGGRNYLHINANGDIEPCAFNKFYTYLKDQMRESEKKENFMTVPAALRELEKIEMIRQNDGNYRLDHAVTATQKEILKAFDMTERNIREQAIGINKKLQQIDQM